VNGGSVKLPNKKELEKTKEKLLARERKRIRAAGLRIAKKRRKEAETFAQLSNRDS
jgi:hypothetical protein